LTFPTESDTVINMNNEWANPVYYCYCCKGKDGIPTFYQKAISLQDAKEKLELHEKEKHGGKQIGTFGIGKTYPDWV